MPRIADLLDLEKEVTDAQAPAPPAPPPPASAPGLQGPVPEAAVDPLARIVAERPKVPEPKAEPEASSTSLSLLRPSLLPLLLLGAGVGALLFLALRPKGKGPGQAAKAVQAPSRADGFPNTEGLDGYGELPELYERLTQPFLWA